MNRRIRTRRHFVLFIKRSRKRFVREKGVGAPPRPSRQFKSPLMVGPRDAQISPHYDAPMLAQSSEDRFPAYNQAIQDPRMSFGLFVESKFVPEHVQHKTSTGQRHYQAILKHLLRPETVNRIFDPQSISNPRLKSVSGWPYLDDVRLCDLTSDHVRRVLAAASGHGYSSQTVKHIKNVFYATISHAQREGCFTGRNPASKIDTPPLPERVHHNLTIHQTKAILNLMQHPDREIALFCLTTDMTMPEICDLQWKHVNLRNSEVYSDGEFLPPLSIAVRASWNRSGLEMYKPGRSRNIDIPEPLLFQLKKLRMQAETKDKNDFVLTTEGGSPIRPESIVVQRLLPIRRTLGIPWLSWQVLRRARVSLLEEFRTQLANQMTERFMNVPCRPRNQNVPTAWLNRMSKASAINSSNRNRWSGGGTA